MNRPQFAPEMKPFSNKRTKRSTAFAALLVWLFALASGVANACLLGAPGIPSHARTHAAEAGFETTRAPAALAGHAKVADRNDDDSDAPKESCLKVCDDGSKALGKLQTGPDLTDPGMAPLVAVVWNAAAPVASAPSRIDDPQPPIVGRPFRVRYSRLAL